MKLGTVVYDGNLYNLDYMNTNEIEKLYKIIEHNKEKDFSLSKDNYKKNITYKC